MKKRKITLILSTAIILNSTFNIMPFQNKSTIQKNTLVAKAETLKNSVEEINFEEKLQIERGKAIKLKSDKLSSNGEESVLVWKSSKPHIADVDGKGVVTAKEKGSVVITAETKEGVKVDGCILDVKYVLNQTQTSEEEYKKIRANLLEDITGGKYDVSNSNINRVLKNISNNAKTYIETMNKDTSKDYLWSDLNDFKKSATITSTYRNIENMAKAYVMNGSELKGDKNLLDNIIYAMEWMYNNKYNENLNKEYDNWWDWEIGIPQSINNICLLLYDDLRGEKLDKYMKAIYFYQPDPFHSSYSGLHVNPYRESEAANRVDVSKVAAYMGALTNDYEQILMARDAIESVLEYTDKEDGFYRDGSFLQHQTVPYVGTYGNVFISGTGNLVEVLKGSKWEIPEENLNTLYRFVLDSFEPFIYKSAALDMVRGRGISRFKETDRQSGHNILNSFVVLSKFASEPYATRFKSLAKYWMEVDKLKNHVDELSNIGLIQECENLLKDNTIKATPSEAMHKNFPIMDRVVHRTEGYLFGVSMFSSRITNFECMNSENKRGWHTADGMTYLYNNDLAQYSEDFWETVNPYRLPGTTVDTIKMKDGKGNKVLSDKEWVGGSTLGNYGINAMEFRGVGPDGNLISLQGKKSWFMFDDEIVALGAGIRSNDNRIIESVVENRKLKDDNSNNFVVNDENKEAELGSEELVKDANWAYLSGNVEGADIGYYFPKPQELKVKRVKNAGKWEQIGSKGTGKEVSKNYLEMWFDHGKSPKDASYEYVILPNKSKEDTKAYAKKPQITVLKNSSDVQAVKENKLNIIGANFFKDEPQTVEGITVNKKASVILRETKDYIEVSVSDPTMKNNEGIEVAIDIKNIKDFEKDEQIAVDTSNKKIKFKVSTENAKGQTFHIKFNKTRFGVKKIIFTIVGIISVIAIVFAIKILRRKNWLSK